MTTPAASPSHPASATRSTRPTSTIPTTNNNNTTDNSNTNNPSASPNPKPLTVVSRRAQARGTHSVGVPVLRHAGLQRKVAKILASRVRFESPNVATALTGLSTLCEKGDNTKNNRRRLRSVLERQSVSLYKQLVEPFRAVRRELESVEAAVSELAESCTMLTSRLKTARGHTHELMQRTSSLQRQKAIVTTRHQLVSGFLGRFQLTVEEEQALDSDDISPAFFAALKRTGRIRADCKELLQTHHQRIGLDLMETLAKRLETSYEKLYSWVTKQSREMTVSPDLLTSFVTALRLLRPMPVYYDHCCQEVAQTRRLLLIRRFINALTRGGPNGVPRPIEIFAHDPVRYVSDTLAWIHQAIASERDFFVTILASEQEDADGGVDMRVGGDVPDTETEQRTDIGVLLAEVLDGISRHAKSRIEQAIPSSGQGQASVSFKLANVIEFYSQTIGALLPPTAQFRVVLQALSERASEAFYGLAKQSAEELVLTPPPIPHDLSPPPAFSQVLVELTDVMRVFSSSLLSGEGQNQAFSPVLSATIDPLLEAAKACSRDLDPTSSAVFHVNVLAAIMASLKRFPFTQSRVETLNLVTATYVEQLVRQQTKEMLGKCGLQAKLDILDKQSGSTRLSDVPGMDAESLSASLQSFYNTLFSVGSLMLPQLDRILNSSVRRTCRTAVARLISTGHQRLHCAISHPAAGYPSASAILLHTPLQIHTILELSPNSSSSSTQFGSDSVSASSSPRSPSSLPPMSSSTPAPSAFSSIPSTSAPSSAAPSSASSVVPHTSSVPTVTPLLPATSATSATSATAASTTSNPPSALALDSRDSASAGDVRAGAGTSVPST